MDLASVIDSFLTGTYTVTRTAKQAPDANGVYVSPSTSTVSIDACVQPLVGRELERLPEGLRGREVRVVYTATQLFTADGTHEPDSITIGSGTWQVQTSEPWEELGGYYRAVIQKDGN